MARLAAKEKVLFYPTPLEIMASVASNLTSVGPGRMIDPCCGTGEPLALLGERLGWPTYGNELHPERYAVARTRLDHCLNGAREFLDVEGQFDLLFDNPPYDQALGGERMETAHIRHDLTLLASGGVGIWVIAEPILDFDLCQLLVTHLSRISVRRFPEPEYQKFKQVVLFGVKRAELSSYTYSQTQSLLDVLKAGPPVLAEAEFSYEVGQTGSEITRFSLTLPHSEQLLEQIEAEGIQTTEAWQTLLGGHGLGLAQFEPVLRLSSGHTAMAIAAGIVNGTEVEIEGSPFLLKGSTGKRIQVREEVEQTDAGAQKTIREREQLCQQIAAFNLHDGTLLTYNNLDDRDAFAEFLISQQERLVEMIDRQFPPLFEPERDMPQWLPVLSKVQAPGKLPGRSTNGGLLPAQQVRAAALATRLDTAKSVILVGEMGVGKTCAAQAIAALIGRGNWKLVVVCPSPIAPKWAREAKTVLHHFGVSVHLIGQKRRQPDGTGKLRKVAKPVQDVVRAMAEPQPSILVMSYEQAKNGPRWEPAARAQQKLLKYAVEVEEPMTGYPYRQIVEKIVTKLEKVLTCPDCGAVLRDAEGLALRHLEQMGTRKRWCSDCGAALWQQVPFSYGGRVALADLLNRHYSGRYNLILDECHATKGADTDIGYAATDLIAGARKVVAMTGTIYAGKSSSIFYLLYRLFPFFRELYAHSDVQRFIEHHGLQETITTVRSSDRYHSSYGYAREQVRTREIPGVSPGMVTMLLRNTAFLKLADVGFILPEYREERLPVPLDERLQPGLDDLAGIYDSAVKLAREGNPSLLSAWLYASLGWLDCPIDEALTAKDEEGNVVATYAISGTLGDTDQLLDEPLAKDEMLMDLVESEIANGRGCGIYVAQINRRNWSRRIEKLLAQRGIYSETLLQSTCPPAERESWYREFVQRCRARGQEPVLICNPNLVKEGLDLIELPTLIETGIEYRINNLRQRDRRSWRLTQSKPVRVVFLYYEETWQETALQLVAAKLKAALMVDGNLAEGLASMDEDGNNLMDALMKAVASGRTGKVEWSGMEIAAIETVVESPQPTLLPEYPPQDELEVEIVQVDVGNGVQLTWGDLAAVKPVKVPRSRKYVAQTELEPTTDYTQVTTKGGGVQYSFL